MAQEIFKIGGSYPDVAIVSLQRNATILDGPAAGRLKNGDMVRDVIGTFYNYALDILPKNENLSAYDDLYETITAPVKSYPVQLPFGQGQLEFDAYIANADDELRLMTDSKNIWDGLAFTVVAMEPQRYYGETWSLRSGSGNQVFTIDGVGFDVGVKKLTRKGAVLDSSASGRSKSGVMDREIIGTFYNYSMEIIQRLENPEEYDLLYYALTAPVDSHEITVPYGQGMLTIQAYVSNASDKLIRSIDVMNFWGELTVDFIAMNPTRR